MKRPFLARLRAFRLVMSPSGVACACGENFEPTTFSSDQNAAEIHLFHTTHLLDNLPPSFCTYLSSLMKAVTSDLSDLLIYLAAIPSGYLLHTNHAGAASSTYQDNKPYQLVSGNGPTSCLHGNAPPLLCWCRLVGFLRI